ncbi:MAG TPA: phosphoenolpyruvate carboxylase [Steroidobacteraceae bacterium]|nr:phosphoenolpyruvate carboxylase [Steroidobacteraceae bacterium]
MNRDDRHFPPHHSPLREDIHALGEIVGSVLREQGGNELYELAEGDRQTAIRRRVGAADVALELRARVQGRRPELARDLLRAFAAYFQLANVAEKVHRIRRRREYFLADTERPQPNGVVDTLAALKAQGLALGDVLELLRQLRIEPVLVAHPTESARRTGLRRQQRIADRLLERSNPLLAPQEKAALLARIRADVTVEWQTAEHPREQLTVADEREHAIFYLSEVLYRIVPVFYEELAVALATLYGADSESMELPLIVRFGTWVGGDMDGATDVHAKSIRETLARQQQVIINNYFGECQALAQQLSQSAVRVGVSTAVTRRIEEYRTLLPGAPGLTPARHDRMPYRVLFGQIAERLRNTLDGRPNGYDRPAQFRGDVALIADSLRAHRGMHAGYFLVRRLLARVDTFGFHLATLDLRQHASVHHTVIAQGLDDPQWRTRTASEQHARLVEVLALDTGPSRAFDALGRRTLAVFESIMQGRHRYGPDAVGLYIVSAAATAADVLAPLVLAHWAGARDRRNGTAAIDVAPQFDSVATLEGCGEVMRQLLADQVYQRHLAARQRQQTVLIGYSESNLESGLVASRLAAYQAQRTLAAALDRAQDRHVLFYSRGGSIPRGGGRIDALLRAAPAESVSGVLRFTEQGEGISQNFGLRANAMRTLERAFNTLTLATLAVRRGATVQESGTITEAAAQLAAASRAAWRGLIEGPGFFEFFRAVTPIDVIERMRIGAVQRWESQQAQNIEGVPAAAWVYAWSQSRHMLPGWFGAGSGLEAVRAQRGVDLLRSAYGDWPFFRSLIDDIEAMLARADLEISACYDQLAPPKLATIAAAIRAEFTLTCNLVCQIKNSTELLDSDRTLQRSIALRNPYVDPMNLMQVDLLRRWRESGRSDPALLEALLASVAGIGLGLQTTG